MDKKYYTNIIGNPIVKIIIGGLVCFLIPALINKLILDNIFQLLNFDDNWNRSIRVSITTFILMPLFYVMLFSRLERRNITELNITSVKSIFLSFVLSFLIISISFIIFTFSGNIKISHVQLPQLIIVNVILIMAFVITEEILFRGILYRILEDSWGTKVAIVASVLIFALLHLGNENTSIMSFLSVSFGGAVLGMLYTITKNLFVPIAFHFGWNLTQVLLGFGLSGGDEYNKSYIFKLKMNGNEIITGGASGVENSILVVIALAVTFGILYKKSQQKIK